MSKEGMAREKRQVMMLNWFENHAAQITYYGNHEEIPFMWQVITKKMHVGTGENLLDALEAAVVADIRGEDMHSDSIT